MYVTMRVEDENVRMPIVLTIGSDDDEHARVVDGWRHFDAAASECFDEEDKKRIFAIVERFPGGIQAFNSHVKILATSLFRRAARQTAPRTPARIGCTRGVSVTSNVIGMRSSWSIEHHYSSPAEGDDIVVTVASSSQDVEVKVDSGDANDRDIADFDCRSSAASHLNSDEITASHSILGISKRTECSTTELLMSTE